MTEENGEGTKIAEENSIDSHGRNSNDPHYGHDHGHDHDHDDNDNTQRTQEYDYLELNNTRSKTTDPDVARYFAARDQFRKGMNIANDIPTGLDEETLERNSKDIVKASHLIVDAWVQDEKAVQMHQRVLVLGQQFEKVLLKDVPEKNQENFYTKESLLFSAWILMRGQQYSHCIDTLNIAIGAFKDIPARVYYLRASCFLALQNHRRCIYDLRKANLLDPTFVATYSLLGSVQLQIGDKVEAQHSFKTFIEKGHPDSADYVNALYALSLLQQPNAKESGKKGGLGLSYFKKARQADERYRSLYGHEFTMTEWKLNAIGTYEDPSLLVEQRKRLEQAKVVRMAASLSNVKLPDETPPKYDSGHCAQCGSTTRKDEEAKDKPLLKCSACKAVYYCSKDCQKKHFKVGHKGECERIREAWH